MKEIRALATNRVDAFAKLDRRTRGGKSRDHTIKGGFLCVGVRVVKGSLDCCFPDQITASNLGACTRVFSCI